MNTALLQPEVRAYLQEHEHTPLHAFILKGSPFIDITVQELAQQLEGKRKAKGKLPRWHNTDGILFPPKLNMEQTSSEATANYKASIMQGTTLADGTGGFGIDAYHFAQTNKQVTHIEMDGSLSRLAQSNAEVLKQENIEFIVDDSMHYFETCDTRFDTIFLDPGRRTDSKGKVFMLKDCLPNVPLYKNLLLSKCNTLWIKTSPILDIAAGIEELRSVTEIHIVAVKNEVKELLWKLTSQRCKDIKFTVVSLQSSDPVVSFSHSDALNAQAVIETPQKYLYEPNSALMKSGAFNWVSTYFNVSKLHEHSHLYTSEELISFAGRRFVIEQIVPYSKRIAKELGITKANITTRNFPMQVDAIRKKLKIKDGGDVYLFFTTLDDGKKVVISTKKVAQ